MKTDFIMSLGPGCRVAWHLKENQLRIFSGPFDWFAGMKLETISHFIKQGNLNGFFENREFIKNRSQTQTKEVRDNTFNIKSLHDFPISIDIDEYYPKFMKIMNKRFSRCIKAFEVFNHITFISYDRDNDSIKNFLFDFNNLYSSKELVFINIEHDETLKSISESEEIIGDNSNIKIKHIKFNDIHEKGFVKTNPARWKGNCEKWTIVCSSITLNNPDLLKKLI